MTELGAHRWQDTEKVMLPWPHGEFAEPRQAHHEINPMKTLNLILVEG